ncbi:MAG: serine/threonine-protein kinase [Myxococcota bacterium]
MKPADPSPASDLATRIAREQVRRGLFGAVGAATIIGRFQVLEELGAGGMGVVFAAYDPRLDRKVALKLLASPGPLLDERGQARLLREARMMARLSHPNIVAVHEVGVHDGAVYVAMEFIRGRTLAAWLEEEELPWTRVLDRFVQAGRGLAAAHREGILHRDLKPSNIMLDPDGRVRVLDFGLAVRSDESAERSVMTAQSIDEESLSASRAGPITRTGQVLGTPLYLAPECLADESASAASDQYAYCITLWQALFGAHPFARPKLVDLHAAALRGDPPRAPVSKSGRVPAWLRAVVERGLSRDPAERWPSMAALVDALMSDPTRVRRRRILRTGVAAAVVGVTFVAYQLGGQPTEACALGPEALAGTWDAQRRGQVEAAAAGSRVGGPSEVATRTTDRLDRYAERWLAESRALCEATQHGRALGPAQAERSGACLEQRRRSLSALVTALAHAHGVLPEDAVAATEVLPAPEACTDAAHLASAEALPPHEIAAKVAALEKTIAELDAYRATGLTADLQARAHRATARAQRLGHAPLQARALLTLGRIQVADGDYPDAERTLQSAFLRARASRVDDVALQAAPILANMLAMALQRPEEALLWAEQACAEAERADAALGRAKCLVSLGEVQFASREIDLAIESYAEALALYESAGGPDHSAVGGVLNNLGNALIKARRHDEAIDVLERALALNERIVGPDSRKAAASLNYLGVAHDVAGRPDRALDYHEDALAVRTSLLGEQHPDVASTYQNLSVALFEAGRLEDALSRVQQARAIWERLMGPAHANVGSLHFNEATVLMDLSRHADAAEHYRRAHRILSKGSKRMQLRGCAALVGMAAAEVRLGRYEDSRAHAEQGLACGGGLQAPPDILAAARFHLAQSLIGQGRDRARALELARQARATYVALGAGYERNIGIMERWLAEHGLGRALTEDDATPPRGE